MCLIEILYKRTRKKCIRNSRMFVHRYTNQDRKRVLYDTIKYWQQNHQQLRRQVQDNECRKKIQPLEPQVQVYQGDWGEVTSKLTKQYNQTFVVLNMANAYGAGGGYKSGCAAQEENMFRRTNCHFNVMQDLNVGYDGRYNKAYTDLINGKNGRVYLDKDPRICFVDSEANGYRLLPQGDIFQFYEMRSAATNLSDGSPFNEAEMEKRIRAQFETAKDASKEYILLGAFGCGAFMNPAKDVARLYKKVIDEYKRHFKVIAFAIYYAGYGPNDNYQVFKETIKST